MVDDSDLKNKIEAILFASGRAVTQSEIETILDIKTPGMIPKLISEIKSDYELREGPVFLVEEGGGWKLTIREKYLPVVHTINPHTELSKALMETLAVIAWKQPVIQSKIVDIRSNKAYDHIKELVELGFISKEKYGRSYLIRPTQKFLDYFDLPNQEAARKLFKDFKDDDLQKKVGEFKNKELAGLGGDEHLGKLAVYDAGVEEDTYADRETLSHKHHNENHLGDLEVVEISDDQNVKSEPSENELPDKILNDEVSEESSEAEKAKRIAEELLESENQNTADEQIPERQLNPELESYLNGDDSVDSAEGVNDSDNGDEVHKDFSDDNSEDEFSDDKSESGELDSLSSKDDSKDDSKGKSTGESEKGRHDSEDESENGNKDSEEESEGGSEDKIENQQDSLDISDSSSEGDESSEGERL